MAIDKTKAFETNSGIIFNDDTGVFYGTGTPVGQDAPVRSYYFDQSNGLMWFKFGVGVNDWRQVRPEFYMDHAPIYTGNGSGQSFNKNTYERLATGHVDGPDALPPNTIYEFQVIASQAGTKSIDIQLYDLTNGAILAGPLSFTETIATYKAISFTPPNGELVIEVQGKKNGNSVGTLFWCSTEIKRTAL